MWIYVEIKKKHLFHNVDPIEMKAIYTIEMCTISIECHLYSKPVVLQTKHHD